MKAQDRLAYSNDRRAVRPGLIPAVATLLALAFLTSCGNGDRPPLGTVHGTVTLDGNPLAKATVSFHPVGGGRQSSDRTDKEGHYKLTYLRDLLGAKIGPHKVTIRTAGAEDTEAAHEKERVPAKYNEKTTLECEVKSGENTFDFTLESK